MESISHDCDELIKSNEGGEKVKERREKFLEDYKKYKNVNEIKKTAIGKKWAQPSSSPFRFDYDYDASYFSSRVYCRTNFAKGKTNAKICEKNGSYICTVKVNNEEFRGDTMNSWYTTLEQFLNKYAEVGYFNRL